MDTNNIVIYAWLDQNGDPFYIGKTNCLKRRTSAHKKKMESGINLPNYNKLRKLLRQGFDWVIKVLEDNISNTEWISRECYWIRHYKQKGCKLYNLTDGGEGMTNASDDLKKYLSECRKGFKHSEETRRKMSEVRKGMKFSGEHKKNLSIARKKRIITDKTRKKQRDSTIGRINIGRFKLIDPNGNIYITENGLADFCRKHNLTSSILSMVANGKRKHHRGWVCIKLED